LLTWDSSLAELMAAMLLMEATLEEAREEAILIDNKRRFWQRETYE
jgi:hypothetical protein